MKTPTEKPADAPAVAEVPKDERTALRETQSKAVMPLIGPLLDAWDGLANDMLALEELAPVAELMAQIDSAMEGGQ
jgi:hypothetical protein